MRGVEGEDFSFSSKERGYKRRTRKGGRGRGRLHVGAGGRADGI